MRSTFHPLTYPPPPGPCRGHQAPPPGRAQHPDGPPCRQGQVDTPTRRRPGRLMAKKPRRRSEGESPARPGPSGRIRPPAVFRHRRRGRGSKVAELAAPWNQRERGGWRIRLPAMFRHGGPTSLRAVNKPSRPHSTALARPLVRKTGPTAAAARVAVWQRAREEEGGGGLGGGGVDGGQGEAGI